MDRRDKNSDVLMKILGAVAILVIVMGILVIYLNRPEPVGRDDRVTTIGGPLTRVTGGWNLTIASTTISVPLDTIRVYIVKPDGIALVDGKSLAECTEGAVVYSDMDNDGKVSWSDRIFINKIISGANPGDTFRLLNMNGVVAYDRSLM